MERWPNFFIVGAPKAGTTSLYAYLSKIPGIFMPSSKEPHFFSINTMPENHPSQPVRDRKKYLSLFKKAKEYDIVGEASPSYLSDPDAPKLIHQEVPTAKIIIMLRDPVDRAYSHYLMLRRFGRTSLSFYDQIQKELKEKIDNSTPKIRLEFGLCSENTQRYMEQFGKKQVKIIIFEEFIQKTRDSFQEVLRFLGSNYEVDEEFDFSVHNPYAIPRGKMAQNVLNNRVIKKISISLFPALTREYLAQKFLTKTQQKPKMKNEDKEFLAKYYKKDVNNLQHLLGRTLPWNNFYS